MVVASLLVCEEGRVADCDDAVDCRCQEPDQAHQRDAQREDGGVWGGVAAHLAALAVLTCLMRACACTKTTLNWRHLFIIKDT